MGALACLWSGDNAPDFLFGVSRGVCRVAGGILVIAVIVVSLVNWRCPSCKTQLGHNWNPRFCPHCGVTFR